MAQLKMVHTVFLLLIGIHAAVSHAAPQGPVNAISQVIDDLTSGEPKQNDAPSNSKHGSKKPKTQSSGSSDDGVVTVTYTPPRPTVTSIALTTTTLPATAVTTPTVTITTTLNLRSADASGNHHEARQETFWPSDPSTMISPQPTCTMGGIQVACPSGGSTTDFWTPDFDDSSIDCHASTLSGLSMDDIRDILSDNICPDYENFDGSMSSPKVLAFKTTENVTATFQLDFNFADQPLGSSFQMSIAGCIEGFTHALTHCNDQDGDLYQHGLVHAVQDNIPLTFLYTATLETSPVEERDGHRDSNNLPASLAKGKKEEETTVPLPTSLDPLAFSDHLPMCRWSKSSVTSVNDSQGLFDADGLVVFNDLLYDCSKKSSAATVCRAKGPWTSTDLIVDLSADFCNWVTRGAATREWTPLAIQRQDHELFLTHHSFWNSLEESQTVEKTACERWIDKLKADCTTTEGFTGGHIFVDDFSILLQLYGSGASLG